MRLNYDSYTDEELIRKLRGGEREVEDYLLAKYKQLVRGKSRALYLTGGDQEDLLQEGMLGLFKAIQEYDESRDARFVTYASTCITNQLYKAVSASMRKKHQPLNDSLSLNELVDESNWDAANEDSPERILLEQESYIGIGKKISDVLSPFENKVLALYLKGSDYVRIAKDLGKSPKSIDNALQRIRKKVRSVVGRSAK